MTMKRIEGTLANIQISKLAWPKGDPNEEQISNQTYITEYSLAPKCVRKVFSSCLKYP